MIGNDDESGAIEQTDVSNPRDELAKRDIKAARRLENPRRIRSMSVAGNVDIAEIPIGSRYGGFAAHSTSGAVTIPGRCFT